ncbi:hypothetical protein CLOM_g13884 [Closterium sp. NIES-68]|nr:hypothetical protein CLOM_g13884 [Closterium sp. NIES-68]GJP67035.1 hypothetical protein CLOP_g23910 [Closterium sp. NIES-67]
MARTLLVCIAIVLFVAPTVFARLHPEGVGHHKTGGHHKSGGHHKKRGGSASGSTSSTAVTPPSVTPPSDTPPSVTPPSDSPKTVTPKPGCGPSNLGYKASVDLADGLIFHWTVSGSNLDAAIEAQPSSGADQGYLSVGFPSKDGAMAPSDAVVGINGQPVTAYELSSYSAFSPSKLAISSPIVDNSSGSLVVKFSRPAEGGVKSLDLQGSNGIIWAFSPTPSFGPHTGQ